MRDVRQYQEWVEQIKRCYHVITEALDRPPGSLRYVFVVPFIYVDQSRCNHQVHSSVHPIEYDIT